ncbi:MAG: Fic family protein [Dysgonamonadaceae bacterium]|nr:Fic family protein [Dysgonamonadaceae bacterium]
MINFDEYIRQSEPDKKEKGLIWQTAIGLQEVDGLKPSAYLIETARQNIDGNITFNEVKRRIDNHYKAHINRQQTAGDRTEEADKVSVRTVEILSENTFTFSPVEYIKIHGRLFSEIYKFAGKIRDYNIIKKEWILDGKTVIYASADYIIAMLDYDFAQEKKFDYKGLNKREIIEHIAKFVSDLWQIHAFGDGNTRTTAVFTIKYLRTFGFKVESDTFAKHSRYFRNALVLANHNDCQNNVFSTQEYLMRFFGNLLLNEDNILKDSELHVVFAATEDEGIMDSDVDKTVEKTEKKDVENTVRKTADKTVEKAMTKTVEKILEIIKKNPKVTQKELADLTELSRRGVEWNITQLKKGKIIERIGGDRGGYWKIIK